MHHRNGLINRFVECKLQVLCGCSGLFRYSRARNEILIFTVTRTTGAQCFPKGAIRFVNVPCHTDPRTKLIRMTSLYYICLVPSDTLDIDTYSVH